MPSIYELGRILFLLRKIHNFLSFSKLYELTIVFNCISIQIFDFSYASIDNCF